MDIETIKKKILSGKLTQEETAIPMDGLKVDEKEDSTFSRLLKD